MIIAFTLLALATATTTTTTTAPAEARKPTLLVLDFRDDGVGSETVRTIRDVLVAHVSNDTRIEVLSSDDVRRAVDLAAERQTLLACSDDACMAELAGALGSEFTLFGSASRLGDLFLVNVTLFDAHAARSVGREVVEVKDLSALPAALRDAGDRLLARTALGTSTTTAPATSTTTGDVLFGVGVGAAAVGGVVAVVCGGLAFASAGQVDAAESFADKTDAKRAQDTFEPIAWVGVAVGIVGAVGVAASFIVE